MCVLVYVKKHGYNNYTHPVEREMKTFRQIQVTGASSSFPFGVRD